MPKKDLMTENDAIHPDKVDVVLNKMSGADEYI